MRRLLILATVSALAAPAAMAPAAQAAGGSIKPVANLKWVGGTDLEFVKIKGRRYAVAGAQNNYNPTTSPGLRVVDVTNPAKPKVTGFLPCNTSQNDIQVRGTYAFMAIDFNQKGDAEGRKDCFTQVHPDQAPKSGIVVVDLANPAKPRAVGFLAMPTGAHNTTVHPTKPLLYVSESESLGVPDPAALQPVWVVDVSKPKAPKIATKFSLGPGDSPHDITFNRKGTRAYVASGFTGATFIVDTTKPLEPTVLGRIYDPAINFAHQADPTPDGKHVIVTDELAGAEGNAYCPGGGLHVWDVSNELAPVKVGAYFIPDTFPSADPGPRPNIVGIGPKIFRCTAHIMRIAPDGKTLVMSWYSQGVQILDISGLTGIGVGAQGTEPGVGIKRIAAWTVKGADTWSAKMDDRGYIVTGDTQRGMDVLKFDRAKAAKSTIDPGVWLDPQQALFRGLRDKARQDTSARTYFCFERATRLGL